MARIHRSKDHLGADVRGIRARYALGWTLRALAALLLIAAYVLLWGLLRGWGDTLAEMYHGWAVAPALGQSAPENAWLAGLHSAWRLLLQGSVMAVRLSPLLLPAIAAGVLLWICSLLMAGKKEDNYAILQSGVEGEHYMLELARKLPRTCHVFVNKYIPHDGRWSETDMILVGPGGVAIVEVKNWSGLVEGDAQDEQVSRGNGKTHYNPVRQVNTHVYRLKNYLLSRGVRVWVVPCVAFVNPKVQLRLTGVTDIFTPDSRETVVVTAQQFLGQVAYSIEKGMSLNRKQIADVVRAIQAAPDRKPGE